MPKNKIGLAGGNPTRPTTYQATRPGHSAKHGTRLDDRACTCWQGNSRASYCIVCATWARIIRRNEARRAAWATA